MIEYTIVILKKNRYGVRKGGKMGCKFVKIMIHGNNNRIEMHQSQQTIMIHNAVPEPVDPIACRRLAVSSRNIAIYI